MRNLKLLAVTVISLGALLWLDSISSGALLLAAESGGHGTGPDLGGSLPLWSVIPFAGILLSIALFPLMAPHFWHHHFPKISGLWALLFAVPFLIVYGHAAWLEILHIYLAEGRRGSFRARRFPGGDPAS